MDTISRDIGRADADARMAKISLRILQAGHAPRDLSKFGELGGDPFNDGPLHYVVTSSGFSLSSIRPTIEGRGGVTESSWSFELK
jgi:hypothetical protein